MQVVGSGVLTHYQTSCCVRLDAGRLLFVGGHSLTYYESSCCVRLGGGYSFVGTMC